MRALFLTNFYPPYGQGGYEQWCQEIAENLQASGHDLLIVTSRHGLEQHPAPEPAWIQRKLHLEMELKSLRNGLQFFTHRCRKEQENLRYLRQCIDQFQPDVILVWGMWNIARSVPVLAEKLLPGRVVYYMGDYWPTLPNQHELYWQAPARSWKTGLTKPMLSFFARQILAREQRPIPEFSHVIFPTIFMREELKRLGMTAQRTRIIYGAADTSLYSNNQRPREYQAGQQLALLYAGRLTPDKGVHVAIEAVGLLVHQHGLHNFRLSVVGDGELTYREQLRMIVRENQLESYVQFCGAQPKQAMPQLYGQADIFLFTSIWQEPFGRVLIEAMAAGAVIVGSPTGGAAEILVDGTNALTFPPGDAQALAAQVIRLAAAPALRQRLMVVAQTTAQENFDIARMAREIEAYLQAIATNKSSHSM
ncbi:MAG: glycosyltransferase family 4 protein [Chloroflexi bacterium]|nr:glycosyltransferase family 4 protein [Chloroflexota bacterium]